MPNQKWGRLRLRSRVLLHPLVALDVARGRAASILDTRFHRPRPGRLFVSDPISAVAQILGVADEVAHAAAERCDSNRLSLEIEAQLQRVIPAQMGKIAPPSGQWLSVLVSLYTAVRLVRPKTVVETGIGLVGASSVFILQALQDEGAGRLVSIDADRFRRIFGVPSGAGIPGRLVARHIRCAGRSRELLDGVGREFGPVDVFVHDSEHTFSNMLYEYQAAWKSGGDSILVLSDDVQNSAFDVFASSRSAEARFVRYDRSQFGFLRTNGPDRARDEPRS